MVSWKLENSVIPQLEVLPKKPVVYRSMTVMGSIFYSKKLLPQTAVKFGLGLQRSDFIFLSKLVNII